MGWSGFPATQNTDWSAISFFKQFWEALNERLESKGDSTTYVPAVGCDVQYMGASAPASTTGGFSVQYLQSEIKRIQSWFVATLDSSGNGITDFDGKTSVENWTWDKLKDRLGGLPSGGWTRKYPHEITAFSDSGSNGQLARFVGNIVVQEAYIGVQTSPPGGPDTDDKYGVKAPATGAWSGHGGQKATWNGSAWVFTTPAAYWTVRDYYNKKYELVGGKWIRKISNETYHHNGSAWEESAVEFPDTITAYGEAQPGDYFGAWLWNEAKAVLDELVWSHPSVSWRSDLTTNHGFGGSWESSWLTAKSVAETNWELVDYQNSGGPFANRRGMLMGWYEAKTEGRKNQLRVTDIWTGKGHSVDFYLIPCNYGNFDAQGVAGIASHEDVFYKFDTKSGSSATETSALFGVTNAVNWCDEPTAPDNLSQSKGWATTTQTAVIRWTGFDYK